uniref:Dicer-1 n=1 Tax=Artemia franciscana TaxID=6661 RepID=A0A1S6YJI5_ARTSF|nr:Dicer-1 [Artemia franciscana]
MYRSVVPEWDVPRDKFTPKDHYAELFEVAAKENITASIGDSESNLFIAIQLTKEKIHELKLDKNKFTLILLQSEQAVEQLIEKFKRQSILEAAEFSEVLSQPGPQVVVALIQDFVQFHSRINLDSINLLIFDNVHLALSNDIHCEALAIAKRCNSHFVGLSTSIVKTGTKPTKVAEKICALEQAAYARCETASDIVSMIKYGSEPVELVVEYDSCEVPTELELEIRDIIESFKLFLLDHRFDMTEYLGDDEEVIEMMNSLPDPTEMPLKIVNELLFILEHFGPWGLDKAALNYLIQLEKLKDTSCYDRHYMLFSALFSVVLQIRAKCEQVFFCHTERERLHGYTKKKVLRLLEILKKFQRNDTPVQKKIPDQKERVKTHQTSRVVTASTNTNSHVTTGRRNNKWLTPKPYHQIDFNAFLGIVFVDKKCSAKVIYNIIKDAARCEPGLDYIQTQYIVGSDNTVEGSKEFEAEARKQEDVLRKFRSRDCNLLVATAVLEEKVELPPCHLVIRFDVPKSYRAYVGSKARAKATNAHFLVISSNKETQMFMTQLAQYHSIERVLIRRCTNDDYCHEDDVLSKILDLPIAPYAPFGENGAKIVADDAIHLINRYCAKLPSDVFTRLTAMWTIEEKMSDMPSIILNESLESYCLNSTTLIKVKSRYDYLKSKEVRCRLRLPINSPLRDEVVGPWMKTHNSAKKAAALKACNSLHKMYEIDDNFQPVTRETVNIDVIDELEYLDEELNLNEDVPRPGTTKRRQYYYKSTASFFRNCLPQPNVRSYLYWLKMTMVEPLTPAQNTRGRRIYKPETASQGFGILTSKPIPKTCQFPIFTRSGEVELKVVYLPTEIYLNEHQLKMLMTFQRYTFRNVLKLEKYPMFCDLNGSAPNKLLVVPLSEIASGNPCLDFPFVYRINQESESKPRFLNDYERRRFQFNKGDFIDAVVYRWYRDQTCPQYFYVAEICSDLSPLSEFPDDNYKTFREYYYRKYGIRIQNLRQPLLDVDHSSSRLNFLTPRYLNRKGVLLPTSSEETKRLKREGLQQKQILVPELCVIHPFSSSLWRQAVCLPSILYRLNSLLVAEDFCQSVGIGTRIVDEWGELQFTWKKKDKTDSNGAGSDIAASVLDMVEVKEEVQDESMEEKQEESQDSVDGIGMWNPEMAENIPALSEEHKLLLEEGYFLEDLKLANLTMIDGLGDSGFEGSDGKGWDAPISGIGHNIGAPKADVSCWEPPEKAENDGSDYANSDVDDFVSEEEEDIIENNYRYANDNDNEFGPKMVTRGDTAEAVEDSLSIFKKKTTCLIESSEHTGDEEWDIEIDAISAESLREFAELLDDHKNQLLDTSVLKHSEEFHLGSIIGKRKDTTTTDAIADVLIGDPVVRPVNLVDVSVPPYESEFEKDELDFTFKFDDQPDLDRHPGPSPGIILQALTMSNANDGINLERLETVGDSFLKFAITVYLFCKYKNTHEGKLSYLRSKRVSNLNLYRLGKRHNLGNIMIATKFNPQDNWMPPGYLVPRCFEQALIDSGIPNTYWNLADLRGVEKLSADEIEEMVKQKMDLLRQKLGPDIDTEIEEFKEEQEDDDEIPKDVEDLSEAAEFVPYSLLSQHSINDKSIADCVEALIGAYLLECGIKGALSLMTWLGMTVLPKTDGGLQMWEAPESAVASHMPRPLANKILNKLLVGYDEFEKQIQYRFNDRAYLLQALTHSSYYDNVLTDCYQRLEFLGDAVLDYLITRFLYEDPRQHCPGDLTDLRSALVNNTTFAVLAVRYGFHRYFKHSSYGISVVFDKFIKMQEENGHKISEELYYLEEEDADEAEDIEVPKALGDIFESVAGAVYLDSGMKLDEVWRVYYRMMKPEIEAFTVSAPKSPIRELLELETDRVKFGRAERTPDGRVRVTVDIIGKKSFKGIGRSYRIAKCTAAKFALRTLERLGMLSKRKN